MVEMTKMEFEGLLLQNQISALQIFFLFFLQENDLRKALVSFIGVRA